MVEKVAIMNRMNNISMNHSMAAHSGESAATPPSDPLASLNFDSLLTTAAKLRPDNIALIETSGEAANALTCATLNERVNAMAAAWLNLGIAPGERIVITATTSPACIVTMIGALRAGIDVALAQPFLSGEDLAGFAIATGAVAISGETTCGDLDLGSMYLQAAAAAQRVRVIIALGDEAMDGAVRLNPMTVPAGNDIAAQINHARLITRDETKQIYFHRQATILAAAIDFITRAQIVPGVPLVTTILPASFAGLTAGPACALMAGSPLVMHAPFDAKLFAATIDALRPVNLIAPATLDEDIAAAGLADPRYLNTLILLTRLKQLPVDMPPEPGNQIMDTQIPVIDLYGIGEIAAIAEPRLSGARIVPLATGHMLDIDGMSILAARRKLHYLAANGRLDMVVALEGAAVSQDGEG